MLTLLTTLACAIAAPTPSGETVETIESGGMTRKYLLHVPPDAEHSKRLPLVLVLHGAGGSAKAMVNSTGWSDKADEVGAVVAYLQGTGERPAWNTGITPGVGISVDDVQFVRDVVKELKKELPIDARRVYATGLSNGAFMTHRLAAELPGVLAAVAPVAGTVGIMADGETEWLDIVSPKAPVPIAMFNGEKDSTVKYDGGPGSGTDHFSSRSAAESVAFWVKADHCTGKPTETTRPDGKVIVLRYPDCAGKTEVMLFTAVDGGHHWPTSTNQSKLSATDAMWKFFARHRLPRRAGK